MREKNKIGRKEKNNERNEKYRKKKVEYFSIMIIKKNSKKWNEKEHDVGVGGLSSFSATNTHIIIYTIPHSLLF